MTREEAINIIRDTYHTDTELDAIKVLIPELRESEDERIRKGIIEIIKAVSGPDCDVYLDEKKQEKYIAWLEKQKELDKMIVVSPEVWDNAISDAFENGKKEGEKQKEQKPWKVGANAYFTPEQKPAEWSEEDSKRYISIGTTLETSVVLSKEDYDANMAWLRELVNAKKYSGSMPSWKPSEEQMEALMFAIEGKCPPTSYMSRRLEDLYESLAIEFNVECKLEE